MVDTAVTEATGTEDGKKTGTALTGKGDRMTTVNIEHDENAVEYAKKVGQYCNEHYPSCKCCTFRFSGICVLKWCLPDEWAETIARLQERKNKHD